MSAPAVLEGVVRTSYGRLLARLARVTGDLVACEDALGDALARALATWPARGVPDRPEAWLLQVARNRLRDGGRHAAVVHAAFTRIAEEPLDALEDPMTPDPRLALLFACAHPAVDEAARTPLLLQATFGLSTEEIAAIALVAPESMKKRLTRGKEKIRLARVPFVVPDPARWPERLDVVLSAIYGAYGAAWEPSAPGVEVRGRRREAADLAHLVAHHFPHQPEALGLAALVAYCESRAEARTEGGRWVPLDAQDPARWDRSLVDLAEHRLREAAALGAPGRFQLEAAIQSCHVARRLHGVDTRGDVVTLYEQLVTASPTVGAWLGLAAATAALRGPEPANALLDRLPEDAIAEHLPYWAARADLLARAGRRAEARGAGRRAAALTRDDGVRAWLLDRYGSDGETSTTASRVRTV